MNTTNQPEQTVQKQISFNNNPFSLAFTEMSKAFKINQNPAIAIIIGGVAIGIANQVIGNTPDILNIFIDENNEGAQLALGLFSLVFGLGFMIVSIVVTTIWSGFTAYIGVKNAKDQTTDVKTALRAGLDKFWPTLGINVLIGLMTLACLLPSIIVMIAGLVFMGMDQEGIGVGLLIAAGLVAIAGLVFALRLSFARGLSLFVLQDGGSGVFASMSKSVSLTKGRVIEVWGMAFPGGIIPIVGGLLTSCGMGAHYLQLKVYREHSVELPKVHFLSWLPLILIGGLLLLIALVGLVIGLAVANR
jgi:hypothetical protein